MPKSTKLCPRPCDTLKMHIGSLVSHIHTIKIITSPLWPFSISRPRPSSAPHPVPALKA